MENTLEISKDEIEKKEMNEGHDDNKDKDVGSVTAGAQDGHGGNWFQDGKMSGKKKSDGMVAVPNDKGIP